jgi:hypothetical protein
MVLFRTLFGNDRLDRASKKGLIPAASSPNHRFQQVSACH